MKFNPKVQDSWRCLTIFFVSVQKFAKEQLAPKVAEMDEKELLDPAILKGLFDQGLMGIETDAKYEGSESSFTSAIVVVEELAKVDPAVSVVCGTFNLSFLSSLL